MSRYGNKLKFFLSSETPSVYNLKYWIFCVFQFSRFLYLPILAVSCWSHVKQYKLHGEYMFIENSQNDQNNRIEQLNNINKTSLEWYHSLNILDTIFFSLKKRKKKIVHKYRGTNYYRKRIKGIFFLIWKDI